ncbi:4146_t:CDS:2 [Entrophospora sp. SA101]|nr:4146_t:CDS:2 [Entrophospora sp. SA101]
MATIEKIEEQLKKAEGNHEEAKRKLEEFEEGEDDRKRLKKLKIEVRKLNNQIRCGKDEKEKKILEGEKEDYEGEIKDLEKKEEKLEAEKKKWGDQVINLQNALIEFGKGEGAIKQLTEQELFRVVIPTPELLSIKTKTTTKAATRKVPNQPVLIWNDFLANAFNASTTLDTSNCIFSKPDIDGALYVEDSAVDMFLNTMAAINNKRLILLHRPESWGKHYMFQGVKGQPDAIRCSADNKTLLKNLKASQILSIVEVKPEQLMRSLIKDGAELSEAYNTALTVDDDGTTEYNRHQKIIRIIRQIFGYMVVNDLQYGLLTTYIRTWFFYCQSRNPDIIYISPAVYINQGHTDNYASFSECVRSKKKGVFKNALRVFTRSMSKKGKETAISNDELLKNMKNYKRNQISFGDLLGGGRSGAVFTAKFYEKIGVLKMVDLYKKEYLVTEMLNEIKIYLGPLVDIQEIFIPKLLKYGVLHEAFVFIFIPFAGRSFAELGNNVTKEEKKLAILGLQAIHARGVMHGDVRLENVMVKRDGLVGKTLVWWIDFAWSRMGCNEKVLNMELIELKRLLGMTMQSAIYQHLSNSWCAIIQPINNGYFLKNLITTSTSIKGILALPPEHVEMILEHGDDIKELSFLVEYQTPY